MEPSPILIIVGSGQIAEDGLIDNRLYTAFCTGCGETDEKESEERHQLICSHCGHNLFRHIRDQKMQEALMEQQAAFAKSGGMCHA